MSPIYNKNVIKPTGLCSDLKTLIEIYIDKFKRAEISEENHFAEIEHIARSISTDNKYKEILHGAAFRIGIAQKLLNLTLKYLWCMDKIKEPCHCPIDSIVINKIIATKPGISLTNWTELDSIEDYRKCITAIREIAYSQNKTIAQWELDVWNKKAIQ